MEDVEELDALRWQIELSFNDLKSVGRLHHLPGSKPEVVTILILSALMFVVLSGWLRRMLFTRASWLVEGFMRTLLVLREHAEKLLEELAQTRPRYKKPHDIEQFRAQCREPNPFRQRAFCIARIVDYSQSFGP